MYSRQDRRENPVRYQVLPAEVSQEASSQSNLALSKRQIKAEFQGQGDTDGPLRVLEQCLPKPTGTPAFVFFDKRPKPNAQRNLDTFTVRACVPVCACACVCAHPRMHTSHGGGQRTSCGISSLCLSCGP